MALNSYLKLKGQIQGDIKGSVTQKGREGLIIVIGFDHEIVSPRDPATGQATGKRMHKPFVITKEIDKSTPLLHNALTNNENLIQWELQCFAAKGTGQEINNFTVKLTDATVTGIQTIMLNNRVPENIKMPIMEEVSFVYQKIEWTWVDGGVTAIDDWNSPISKPAKAKKQG